MNTTPQIIMYSFIHDIDYNMLIMFTAFY